MESNRMSKHEVQNLKFETSTNSRNSNDINGRAPPVSSIRIWCFEFVSCFAVLSPPLFAQALPALDGRDGRNLLLENFRPRPMLKVQEHPLARAKFPVVDVHTHFRHKFHGSDQELANWVKLMDRNHIAVC